MSKFAVRSASVALLGVVATGMIGGPVSALSVTTLGVYTDEASATCKRAATCSVYFELSDEPILIQSLSCNVVATPPGTTAPQMFDALVGQTNEEQQVQGDQETLGPIGTLGIQGATRTYQFLVQPLYGVPAGLHPTIQVDFDGNYRISLDCTIAGISEPE